MRLAYLLAIGSAVVGCRPQDEGGLSSSGEYNVDGELGEDISGSSGDDTDDTDEPNPDAPTLTDFSAALESASGVYSIALVVTYTDPQDDVEGGYLTCRMSVSGGGEEDCVEDDGDLGIDNGYIPIDGTAARLDEDQDGNAIIKFNMERDEDETYALSVFVVNVEGNQSNTLSAEAE